MLRKLFAVVAAVLAMCFVGNSTDRPDGYDKSIPNSHEYQNNEINVRETLDYSDDEIAVIVWYENFAWAPTSQGYFVTCGGDVYLFDFIGDEDDAELYERSFEVIYSANTDKSELSKVFEELRSIKEPYDRIDKDTLQLCRSMADDIDPSAAFEKEHTACDAGNESVYIMSDGGPIKIYTEGDNTGTISDSTAKKILKKLRKADIIDEAWNMRNSGHRPAGFYDYPGQTK